MSRSQKQRLITCLNTKFHEQPLLLYTCTVQETRLDLNWSDDIFPCGFTMGASDTHAYTPTHTHSFTWRWKALNKDDSEANVLYQKWSNMFCTFLFQRLISGPVGSPYRSPWLPTECRTARRGRYRSLEILIRDVELLEMTFTAASHMSSEHQWHSSAQKSCLLCLKRISGEWEMWRGVRERSHAISLFSIDFSQPFVSLFYATIPLPPCL